jgi:diguanylate cyclase (GGDEF)-like protein
MTQGDCEMPQGDCEIGGTSVTGRPSEGLLWPALSSSGDGFAIYRIDHKPADPTPRFRLELVNPAGARWFGVDATLDAGLRTMMAAVAAGAATIRHLIERDPGPGGAAAVLETVITRLDPDRVVLAGRDVTELVRGQRSLAAAYEQTAEVRATLQTALDASTEAFAVYDVVRDGDSRASGLELVLINMAGAQQLGVGEPEDLTGGLLEDFFPDARACGMWQAVLDALEAQVTRTFRRQEHDQDGAWVAAWDNTITSVGEERVVITWREVTVEQRRENQLEQAHDLARHASTHDALTGLANRILLDEALRQAVAEPAEPAAQPERIALVYVDLDHFKQVNDTWGHSVGDTLLQAVSGRLNHVLRSGDLAARVGGDEFVLLLRRLPPDWDAAGFLARCRAALGQPVLHLGGVINPSASFGLVTSSPTVRDPDVLLRLADHEMYRNKQARRHKQTRHDRQGRRDQPGRDPVR